MHTKYDYIYIYIYIISHLRHMFAAQAVAALSSGP